MAQHWFSDVQQTIEGNVKAQLMFPRYSSFLGSLGLLLTQTQKAHEKNTAEQNQPEEEFPEVCIKYDKVELPSAVPISIKTKSKIRRKRNERKFTTNSAKKIRSVERAVSSDSPESIYENANIDLR